MSEPARLVVVGPGRVGRSLAAALATAGEAVELRGGVDRALDVPLSALIFAVPDDALAEAAEAWADALDPAGKAPPPARPAAADTGVGRGGSAGPSGAARRVALHTSGVHGPEALARLRQRLGFAVASWHPLTSLAAPSEAAFEGVTFGVAGDEPAVERARELADRLGGRAAELAPGEHARYHAAAVFASNHLAACLAVAAEELAEATDGRAGLDDLAPLARAALENALGRGLPGGVTGPVQRGDVGTVRRHLEALSPERRSLYRGLARELLAVVQDRLPAERARELRDLLGPLDA